MLNIQEIKIPIGEITLTIKNFKDDSTQYVLKDCTGHIFTITEEEMSRIAHEHCQNIHRKTALFSMEG